MRRHDDFALFFERRLQCSEFTQAVLSIQLIDLYCMRMLDCAVQQNEARGASPVSPPDHSAVSAQLTNLKATALYRHQCQGYLLLWFHSKATFLNDKMPS